MSWRRRRLARWEQTEGELRGLETPGWLLRLFEVGSGVMELVGRTASSSSYLRRSDQFLAGLGSVIDTAGVIITFH